MDDARHSDKGLEPATAVIPIPCNGRRRLLKLGATLLAAPALAGVAERLQAAPPQREAGAQWGDTTPGRFSVALRDVQILFVDLQQALTKGSQTIPPQALAVNAAVLAKIGKLLKIPMTFSVVPVAGQPGVLIPELLPFATEQNTFHRIPAGSFSDQAMVSTLANHSRKTLIIAGYATEVAVLQSALGALAAGYRTQVPVDVTGSASSRTEAAAMRQMELAGAIPTSVISLAAFLAPNFSEEPGSSVLSMFSELRTAN